MSEALRRGVRAIAAVVLALAAPANSQRLEAGRDFGIYMSQAGAAPSADEWAVSVTVWTADGSAVRASRAVIEVDGAAVAIEGAGSRKLSVGGAGPTSVRWTLLLRRSGSGRAEIRGTVRLDGANSNTYKLHEESLLLDVGDTEVRVAENRTVRQLSVRDGRKFRYAGPELVAVDGDEDQEPHQIESRPELVVGPVIFCGDCGLTGSVAVPVIVTVGKDGKITWVSRFGWLDERGVPDRLRTAVARGLEQFLFRPAIADGKPIADYCIVNVTLAPPP